jgi:hypothetical protein
MSRLLNKVALMLEVGYIEQFFPDEIKRDKWVEVVTGTSLLDFSKYVPNEVPYQVHTSTMDKDGWYYIDESFIPGNVKILGIRDLDFEMLSRDSTSIVGSSYYGVYDTQSIYSFTDVMDVQMLADTNSIFNNGIYVEFKEPNRIRLKTSTRDFIKYPAPTFPITIYLSHAENLLTISPTKMELLEELSACDIAKFLYATLKYFDHFETSFGNVELKLETIEEYKNKRDEVMQKLKDGFISAGGSYPLFMTV